MDHDFTKKFNKQFANLPHKKQLKVLDTVKLFLRDSEAHTLRNHALTGEWAGYRSISAGGDLRLHFRVIDDTTVLFVAVGTHSQLYT
ncbi:MAG: type II toxin-antitoxin system mRNA interferase toxin, RelE/StbE family [Candidatus Saccharimonadales bacterium]